MGTKMGKRAAVAKSEPELPLKPTNQTQMTSDLKVDTGLPCKHDFKPANQTQMTTHPDLKDNQILNKKRS